MSDTYDLNLVQGERFSRDFFSIKEWRGDKYVEGIYAESTANPESL